MSLKVLFVDDSISIVPHLKSLISKISGIELAAHSLTFTEAHEMFLKHTPEIIILDIFIKEESGIDFLSFLNLKYPETNVIILTNNTDAFYKNKCKSLGVSCFFDKSYEFDKITDCLLKIKE